MNTPLLRFDAIGTTCRRHDPPPSRYLRLFALSLMARIARARERFRIRRETRAIFHVLHGLDDRTLRDLGFHRCEIWSVAAEATGEAESTRMQTVLRQRTPL
jgi:uncharacterized protein YjiS (DUF1127 family)